VLRVKLRHLDGWNRRRSEIAARYAAELRGVELPRLVPGGESVHHLFPVQTERRDALMGHLAQQGVGTLIHYAVPLHLQPSFGSWGYGPGSFPVAEAAAGRLLSLPIFPHLADEEVAAVVAAVNAFHA
jgi:dTDP-4-amino-4,6-dideoxygalactose transaminase